MPAVLLPVGMTLIAFGTWRLESRVWRETGARWPAIGLCLLGVAVAAMAANEAALNWRLRVAVVCSYSAAASFCGAIVAAMAAKRRAGAVITELGTGAPAGLTFVAAVVAPISTVALIVRRWMRPARIPRWFWPGRHRSF
jgi:hypothetical protein